MHSTLVLTIGSHNGYKLPPLLRLVLQYYCEIWRAHVTRSNKVSNNSVSSSPRTSCPNGASSSAQFSFRSLVSAAVVADDPETFGQPTSGKSATPPGKSAPSPPTSLGRLPPLKHPLPPLQGALAITNMFNRNIFQASANGVDP
eukprot:64035-Prorocentrum_minimum.AAC.1